MFPVFFFPQLIKPDQQKNKQHLTHMKKYFFDDDEKYIFDIKFSWMCMHCKVFLMSLFKHTQNRRKFPCEIWRGWGVESSLVTCIVSVKKYLFLNNIHAWKFFFSLRREREFNKRWCRGLLNFQGEGIVWILKKIIKFSYFCEGFKN